MSRRCKCGCRAELPAAAKCTDYYSKAGYVDIGHKSAHDLVKMDRAAEKKLKTTEKAARVKHKELKQSIKKRTGKNGHYDALKKALHYYIKHVLRKGEPCYTCGKQQSPADSGGAFHVGHFIPAKEVDPRRFMMENLRIQCYSCNAIHSGKRAEYRMAMVEETGLEHVEWLEADINHLDLKERYPDIKDIKKEAARYRKLTREA